MQLVVCLRDKDLFFETFFNGQYDLDDIKNELHEMDEDIRIEIRGGGDIAYFFVLLRIFLQGNEYFNNFVGRNLARLCCFGEAWIIYADLDVGSLRAEWGVGPCSPSLVFPRYSKRAILAKIIVDKKTYFKDLLRGFSISTRP